MSHNLRDQMDVARENRNTKPAKYPRQILDRLYAEGEITESQRSRLMLDVDTSPSTAGMTIAQAYAIVNEIAPEDQSIMIGMDLWWFSHENKRESMKVEFSIASIHDGKAIRAPTLDAAVQAFIAANQPQALPEEVDALVAEVTPETL